MTGYGKSTIKLGDKYYGIEIKSLNSKSLDLNFKAVTELRGKEIEIRKIISTKLIRGKIDLYFQEEKTNGVSADLNLNLIESYYQQLSTFAAQKGMQSTDILPAILRFNDINKSDTTELTDLDFDLFFNALNNTLNKVTDFRLAEGKQLEIDLKTRISLIQQYLNELLPFESQRLSKIREKLTHEINQYITNSALDKNRFEEELIYYIEKIDINEEKVRLETHCKYFLEITNESTLEKGKKLGFIAQEIGREINTIGSKANDATMQKYVVQMKDELEKIKEQLLNIL